MAETIFGVIGAAVGVAGFVFGLVTQLRNKQADDKKEGKEDGMVYSDLGYIKAGIDDLKRDGREMRNEVQALHDKVTRTEESCKQAHKRIDALAAYHQPN